MTTQVPLIGVPQEQQAYPQIGLNFVPNGMVVNIQLGPTTVISQLIDASTMDQVASEWRKSRKHASDVQRAVQNSKL